MEREEIRRWHRAGRVLGSGLLVVAWTSCATVPKSPNHSDGSGSHAHPSHDAGPERTGEPVRVRDAEERARMERYIADFVRPEDVATSIELSPKEIIDCVLAERQPALRRPELRGHVLQQEPPLTPRNEPPVEEASTLRGDPTKARPRLVPQEYGGPGRVCPEKTVPIRRLSLEILDNFETLEDFFRARPPHLLAGATDLHQYATAQFLGDNWGAQSTLNVWPPYTERPSEFSLSQIGVFRGSGSDRDTVETGWQKFRNLYGDYRPRLFIYFTPDNYGSGGCYNLSCSAFVQVNNTIYIGGGFTNISDHPHPSTAWEFTIRFQRHATTGDWWLKYGDTWVGYYPARLFDSKGLGPRADGVMFFGEIVDEQVGRRHTHTDMGSGHFPSDGFGYAAYQRRVRTITTGTVWNIRPSLTASRTNANCYDISLQSSLGDWESYFYFGGSGFSDHCQ
jgi:hypothetical protein